jgi:hypothetical protein
VESSEIIPIEVGNLAEIMNAKDDPDSKISVGKWVAVTGEIAKKSPKLPYFEMSKPNEKNAKRFRVMTDAEVRAGTTITVVGRVGNGESNTSSWIINDPIVTGFPR